MQVNIIFLIKKIHGECLNETEPYRTDDPYKKHQQCLLVFAGKLASKYASNKKKKKCLNT